MYFILFRGRDHEPCEESFVMGKARHARRETKYERNRPPKVFRIVISQTILLALEHPLKNMKIPILSFIIGISVLAASANEVSKIVELPRPNSGTFSFQQAEARKLELLLNESTKPLTEWKNPYMGFAIHIRHDDSMTVYGHWLRKLDAYNQPQKKRTIDQIKALADELPSYGNPAGILITSEKTLKDSKAALEILDALFVPSVQLFYVSKNTQNESEIPRPK